MVTSELLKPPISLYRVSPGDTFQSVFFLSKERVQAIETNSGPTLAADELFNLIIRRPNWIQDLARALRDPNVKLAFLADDIDNLLSKYIAT